MEDRLKEYDMRIEHSEAEDREPIDFDIRDIDTDERYATVWGSEPFNDIQVDCEHPEQAIDYHYDDDHHQGCCELCGAWCDVGYHKSDDDGYEISEPFVVEWYLPNRIGGVIGEYIDKLKKEF